LLLSWHLLLLMLIRLLLLCLTEFVELLHKKLTLNPVDASAITDIAIWSLSWLLLLLLAPSLLLVAHLTNQIDQDVATVVLVPWLL